VSVAGASGWAVALALAVVVARLRRRLDLVALAAHELRGPVTALGLAAAALGRDPGGAPRALAVETALERMRRGLADLDAARAGRRAPPRPAALNLERIVRGSAAACREEAQLRGRRLRFAWGGEEATVRADRGRLAQVFGNLLANAVEHGSGTVEVRGRRGRDTVLVEVRDGSPSVAGSRPGRDRGRGLRIAAGAVEEAGGTLSLERTDAGTTASVVLPVDGEPDGVG
jgi:signal transduction histidine kinase